MSLLILRQGLLARNALFDSGMLLFCAAVEGVSLHPFIPTLVDLLHKRLRTLM